ncbi:hypothetical protein [Micromonospora sp. NPDC005324]|uniref:hypothetical protein n=1 Tax=Micromonospora sp. NPDC005324 TaxID=3157033 RepID=UPI0033AACC7E
MTSITTPLASGATVHQDAWKPLRRWLRLDALVTGANALAYLAAAPLLSGLLGPEPALLRSIGAFLAVFTVGVLLVARQVRPAQTPTAAVIVVNLVWTAASVLVAVVGAGGLTGPGRAWAVAQALVVASFGIAQASALRSTPR